MSQADELLNSLTEEQIALYSGGSAEEPYIVIGADRRIVVPESLKRIAVEGDHNVETVTFSCPRYWDEHDLSQMILYINYRLPNGFVGSYIAENIKAVDESTMTFTWTVTRTVSQYKGSIAFLVCGKSTEMSEPLYIKSDSISGIVDPENGEIVPGITTTTGEQVYEYYADVGGNPIYFCWIGETTYRVNVHLGEPIETLHWNTELCTDMYVSEGLEADPVVEQDYPDILTQLLERMTVVEGAEAHMEEMSSEAQTYMVIAQEARDKANEHETIAGAYAATVLDSASEIRNSYANAIKGAVSGEIVRVDDVSPLEHDVKVKVRGKNLIPFPYVGGESKVANGITFTRLEDGGIHIDGTNNHSTHVEYPLITTNSITINASQLTMYLYGPETNDIYCTVGGGGFKFGEVKSGTGMVLDSNGTSPIFTYGLIRVKAGATVSNVTVYPMLNEGPTALPYEPYIDPSTIGLIRCNKNICMYPYNATQYANGITFTANEDGSITLNGTNNGEANSVFYISKDDYTTLPKGSYVGSAMPAGINFMGVEKGGGYLTLDRKITINESTSLRSVYIQVAKGNTTVFNNVKVYPMLNVGTVADNYERPNHWQVYRNDDGSVDGVTSLSPTMTIFTDTPGAIVDVIYNRDTTKMFESYVLTDKAKDEISVKVKNHISSEIDAIEASLGEIIKIQEKLI